MTFIISAATENVAIQVSDTRVTDARDGRLICDRSVKMILVHCQDAKVIISFTGLATISGTRVDKWLVDKLTKFECWNKVFQETMNYIRDEATAASKFDQRLQRYGLEIVAIGLGYSPESKRQPAIAFVTNVSETSPKQNQFRRVDPRGRAFQRYILTGDIRHYVSISGAVDLSGAGHLTINGMRRKLQKELQEFPSGADPRTLLNRIVAMLRLHRKRPELAHLIGNYCVAAAVNSDFSIVAGSYGMPGHPLLLPLEVKRPKS